MVLAKEVSIKNSIEIYKDQFSMGLWLQIKNMIQPPIPLINLAVEEEVMGEILIKEVKAQIIPTIKAMEITPMMGIIVNFIKIINWA